MKTRLTVVFAAAVLVLSMAGGPAAAAHPEPSPLAGACPATFEPHHAHEHSHDGSHNHIGNDTDQNEDGWICVKPAGEGDKNHIHIDNHLPL